MPAAKRKKNEAYPPELRAQIMAEVKAGNSIMQVAKRHGVAHTTVYEWRRQVAAGAKAWRKVVKGTIAALESTNGHVAPVVVRSEVLKARADANEARAIIRKLTDELDVLHRAFGKMVIDHPEVAQFFSRGKEGAR